MSESILILFLTTFISFAGSMQPGPVNLAVVQATLNCSFKTGVWVALSGALPEIIYAGIALKSYAFLANHQTVFKVLGLLTIPFFLIAGIYSYSSEPVQKIAVNNSKRQAFKGFAGGMLNPQLLPFWLVVLVFLSSFFSLKSPGSQFSFVFGAAMGAFLILLLLAYLAHRFQDRLTGMSSTLIFLQSITRI
jgi:threonine/homoserine/homoserine lactone efflux protein